MKFSALLSVYCSELPTNLDEALTSIYDSQVLKPSQIVLVKDGPLTAGLEAVVESWCEKLGDLLTLVTLAENVGLGAALNEGLEHCKYELVARMDTDDIALPERFSKQVAFMRENPAISACSAQLEEWDEAMQTCLSVRRLPTDPDELVHFSRLRSPLSHPLVMYRKSVVLAVGGYPPLRKAQDYALWSVLLSQGYQIANLPDILLKMRTGSEMMARRGFAYFMEETKLLKLQKEVGFLTTRQFLVSVCVRFIIRNSPVSVQKLMYNLFRS